jgi:GDPmannose 4,6-dehydratase
LRAKALITGINGQDGSFLAKFLLERNYEVVGTTRDIKRKMVNLERLDITDDVTMIEVDLLNLRAVRAVIDTEAPDYIYGLASESSVLNSFANPQNSVESITISALNILDSLRLVNSKTRFYNASSSEIFGDVTCPASEITGTNPKSPYAIAKLSAQHLSDLYRNSYGVNASSGILFNHESPLRSQNFFSKKVIRGACLIKKGHISKLSLGQIDGVRDWGWAPDFVEAMHAINTAETCQNYVVATGIGRSLEDFVQTAFEKLNLTWQDYVEIEPSNFRKSDIFKSIGDPSKAARDLQWKSSTSFESLISQMIESELQIPTP